MTELNDRIDVGFDSQAVAAQHRGGISRYFVELIKAFHDHPDLGVKARPLWRLTRNEHALSSRLGRAYPAWRKADSVAGSLNRAVAA